MRTENAMLWGELPGVSGVAAEARLNPVEREVLAFLRADPERRFRTSTEVARVPLLTLKGRTAAGRVAAVYRALMTLSRWGLAEGDPSGRAVMYRAAS